MRLASFIASTVGGILILCPISNLLAQSGVGGVQRSGWYLGGGIGSNWAADLDQEGWNRESTCYPTDACFDADPIPEISGYRWRYDIPAAAGAVFEISAGRIFDRTRLELSFAQRKNSLDQMFRGITYYDGTPLGERHRGSVVSNGQASIDSLLVRTLSLNAYYDFPDAFSGISPYLGNRWRSAPRRPRQAQNPARCPQDTSANASAYDPPLSFYNSSQDADLSDTVLAGHLHAGVDYSLSDKTLLGLKLTYSMLGSMEARDGYAIHPFHEQDPDFSNYNRFPGARSWALTFTVKRLFGN